MASTNCLSVESATVYRGGGRRWFTKKAAARAIARQAIRERCYCEKDDAEAGYPGYACDYHRDPERYKKLVDRFASMTLRALSSQERR